MPIKAFRMEGTAQASAVVIAYFHTIRETRKKRGFSCRWSILKTKIARPALSVNFKQNLELKEGKALIDATVFLCYCCPIL